MKVSELGKPATAKTKKEVQDEVVLTPDRIKRDLCDLRETMQQHLPEIKGLRIVAEENNRVGFQTLDAIRTATEKADQNTDRVIGAIDRLIEALKK